MFWVHVEEDFLMHRICGGRKDYGFEIRASRRSMVAQLRYRGWGVGFSLVSDVVNCQILFLSKEHDKWIVGQASLMRKDLGQRCKFKSY